MKRRRSSAPGRLRPDGRWAHPILFAIVLAVFIAACGQATSTEPPTAPAAPSSEASPTESSTIGPSTGAPTDAPSASAEPTTAEPTATGSAGSSPASSAGTGSASSCSGSDENRDFFASMAAAVDWTVYCPVLPDGWFVDDGQYRLANGGWMEISYDGPGDARFVFRQGAFCETADGCVPAGTEIGDAPFADRTGRIVAGADGSWAVVVDRGVVPSWLLVVQGLDETGARTIAADLQTVTG